MVQCAHCHKEVKFKVKKKEFCHTCESELTVAEKERIITKRKATAKSIRDYFDGYKDFVDNLD